MSTAYSEIVEDLWTDILCLLPVKTLLVMRAVNKFFLALINSGAFAASFHRSRINRDVVVVSLVMDYGNGDSCPIGAVSAPAQCRIGKRDGPDLITYPTNLKTCFSPFPVVAGSLDGLVLLAARSWSGSRNHIATLWNPSIRKYRQLPLPSSLPYSYSRRFSLKFGLGHDPSSNDYKVFAMVNLMQRREAGDNLQRWGVWVYSVFRTRSWSPVLNSGLSTINMNIWSMCDPTPFKGSLFWIERGWNNTSYVQRLSRFHLATNRFRYSTMPDYTAFGSFIEREWNHQSLTTIDIGVGRQPSLAVCKSDVITGISIWIMDDVDAMTWTRLYTASPTQAYGIYFKYWIKGVAVFNPRFNGSANFRNLENVGTYLESLLLLN